MNKEDKPLDDRLGSGSQQNWTELSDLLRGHLIRIAMLPDLKPEEVCYLVTIGTAARAFDLAARTFDHELSIMESRTAFCGH